MGTQSQTSNINKQWGCNESRRCKEIFQQLVNKGGLLQRAVIKQPKANPPT